MIEKTLHLSESDLVTVSKIWLEANITAHDFIPKEYWIDNLEEVKTLLPQATIYTYKIEGEIVGFMGIVDTYIAGIFVQSDFQGKGIGQKLLAQAKLDYQELSLAVYEKNDGAYRFYLREGFIISEKGTDEENQEKEFVMMWKK